MTSPFWTQSADEAFTALGSGPGGLTSVEAGERLRRYGANDASGARKTPAWLRFLGRFKSPLVLILLAASLLSAVTGDVPSFVIVTAIVLMSVTLDFLQERRAEEAVEALKARVALRARILRDGAFSEAPVLEVVPGDVVALAAGDLAPADGLVVKATDFFVNQALLTGEPYPVEKRPGPAETGVEDLSDALGAVFAGTSVVSGAAEMLVCRTGPATAVGAIARSLAARPPPTAFEVGVQKFSILILRITVVLVLFVLVESIARHTPWIEALLFATALAVGLTPELLPMILTVTLSRGAVLLAERKVVVKRLAAIHNLGAINVLCTDKTGTLTEARITLAGHVDARGVKSEAVLELLCVNSRFESGLRSAMDDAILAHRQPDLSSWSKIDEVPFDFERRRVSVLVQAGAVRRLVVKGAPEDVLAHSAFCLSAEGVAEPITDAMRSDLARRFAAFGADGYRALGVAFKDAPPQAPRPSVADETDLTFCGWGLFLDPPKASAAGAVRALAESGVEVKILTGDNEQVSRHVCDQLNIPVTGVIGGDALARLSDEALLATVLRTNLFCRVNPQQKQRVIQALKRLGRTVGYVGDGVNDAPSLHAADVGISVDSGADVAKAAAEIILLEQDLGVLAEGVRLGRRTVANVTKYILMASSANFGNILSMVIAGLILPYLPLLPIQVLLTNLIYDVSQTGLPVDEVDKEAISRPVQWDIRLVERFMITMGPVSTAFDLVTFAVLLLILRAGAAEFRTGWFIESLITQILMIFSVRTRRWLFASKPGRTVTVIALVGAAVSVVLPLSPLGAPFRFVSLPAPYFAFLALAVVSFLVVVEATKQIFYRWIYAQPPGALGARSQSKGR